MNLNKAPFVFTPQSTMVPHTLFLVLACWISCVSALPSSPVAGPEYVVGTWDMPLVKSFWTLFWGQNVPQVMSVQEDEGNQLPGWYDPSLNGGRMLDFTTRRYGEPLNVIISGSSDPFVLTDEGLRLYTNSLGYAEECLGLHMGHLHEANLGDGDSRKTQLYLARQSYFPILGTCWESLTGGHHFRAWKQNGTLANSGAWFIGASKELDSRHHHQIVPNGYNIGRDWIVLRATHGSSWKGMRWNATVEWREDLLEAGSDGINHGIAQDGRVAVLNVQRIPF
ncbi:hypothetical protein D9756_005050 [Leucocoprinus leucothites]|uniref:Uncharacterized protein n=1 Tax=Leucocoprinus leucothites TaxID=201217 RepID=A0A8H5G8Z3_9AGAR|nr:hypothetical protein D9756_005050 [Leucoagaricus leucothites]